MRFDASYRITSGVAAFVEQHIAEYERGIKYVGIGTDYEKKGRPQPCVLVSPSRIDFDRDVYQGSLQSDLSIDCLISVDGYDSDLVLQQAMKYADAITSLVTSNDQLDGLCEHAEVTQAEFYPGGTGNRQYAVVSIAITEYTHT